MRVQHRLGVLFAIAAALLTPLAVSPATAAGTFGPEQVISDCCLINAVTSLPDGTSAAVAGPPDGGPLLLLTGHGRSWRTTTIPVTKADPIALAGDETGLYLLYTTGVDSSDDIPPALSLIKQSAAGWGLPVTLSDQPVFSASLVAHGGTWWAVWSEDTPGAESAGVPRSVLYEAHTMGVPAGRTQVSPTISADEGGARLALSPSGGVDMVYFRSTRIPRSDGLYDTDDEIRLATNPGVLWTSRTLTTLGRHRWSVPYEAGTSIASNGKNVFIAVLRHGSVDVGSDETGSLVFQHVPIRGHVYSFPMAMSGSQVIAAMYMSTDGRTGYMATAERKGGRWSDAQRLAFSGTPVLIGVTSTGGQATVFTQQFAAEQRNRYSSIRSQAS